MKKDKYNPSTGGMNIAGEIETRNLSINYKNAKKKNNYCGWFLIILEFEN